MSEGDTPVNQPPDGQSEQHSVTGPGDGASDSGMNQESASHRRESPDGAENPVTENNLTEDIDNGQPNDENLPQMRESSDENNNVEDSAMLQTTDQPSLDANNNEEPDVGGDEPSQPQESNASQGQGLADEGQDGNEIEGQGEGQEGEEGQGQDEEDTRSQPATHVSDQEQEAMEEGEKEAGLHDPVDQAANEGGDDGTDFPRQGKQDRQRPKSDTGHRYEDDGRGSVQGSRHSDDVKADTHSTKTGGSPLPVSTPATQVTQVRGDNRKHTTTPADDSGLTQPVLPVIQRGQARVQQMGSSISHARRSEDVLPTIQPIRSRVPPKLVRLATVTVSPAKARPVPQGPSLYYEEPKKPSKVITWDEAHNSRPPLRIDMEGPGPCSYSPLNKPLSETNAPSFTFGSKCYPERTGGARTSWGKSWFQSKHLWHSKADFLRESLWPSPNHYPKPPLLGPRQRTMTEAPSYTFGHKQEFSIVKPGTNKEPSPNEYERQNADRIILKRAPSFTHQFRREGTVLWGRNEPNPGPAAYTPVTTPRIQKPSFTIQGIRREKSHVLGPYSTL